MRYPIAPRKRCLFLFLHLFGMHWGMRIGFTSFRVRTNTSSTISYETEMKWKLASISCLYPFPSLCLASPTPSLSISCIQSPLLPIHLDAAYPDLEYP